MIFDDQEPGPALFSWLQQEASPALVYWIEQAEQEVGLYPPGHPTRLRVLGDVLKRLAASEAQLAEKLLIVAVFESVMKENFNRRGLEYRDDTVRELLRRIDSYEKRTTN